MLASAPAASTSDTAPIADDAYGAGHTRAPELLEHDRGVDHAHPGAAVRLGHEQADARRARARPCPHRVVAERVAVVVVRAAHVRVIGAWSARKRRTESRSISWSARTRSPRRSRRESADTNVRKLPCAAMRLQYAPEDEAFRAELDRVARGEPARRRARCASRKQSSAHLPEWAREWQRTLFDAGWLVPGWPPELGGRNATPTQQMIYFEEMYAPRDPAQREPAGPRHHRPVDQRLRHAEQKERFLAADAARRDLVVPRHERAGRGQRPREPADARRARSATSSSSTARRCGRRARTTPTGASASCAPIPTCRSTRASAR